MPESVERDFLFYREQARLALLKADASGDAGLRQNYLDMAAAYHGLAGTLERIERHGT